jgi:hypothetical protein
MRKLLIAAVLSLVSCTIAVAQSGSAAPAVYPMPPPESVVITTPGGNDIVTRSATDRHSRCLQYGASIGVPADKMSEYLKRCVLQ